jgi:hypothetical protein
MENKMSPVIIEPPPVIIDVEKAVKAIIKAVETIKG